MGCYQHRLQFLTWLILILFGDAFVALQGSPGKAGVVMLASAVQSTCFGEPPYIALITEPNSCDSEEQSARTLKAITKACETGCVNLVSMRLTKPVTDEAYDSVYQRAISLTRRLVELSDEKKALGNEEKNFKVVCSSDWVELALEANAHGVHVKESQLSKISSIREQARREDFLIGTSTHSVASARQSFSEYHPDYYFVGTCFLTASHPEKSVEELEGPTLPGQVRQVLLSASDHGTNPCPAVFAIGGIDENNCAIPVQNGADGVAVIRAILQAEYPSNVATKMREAMSLARVTKG